LILTTGSANYSGVPLGFGEKGYAINSGSSTPSSYGGVGYGAGGGGAGTSGNLNGAGGANGTGGLVIIEY
jgi:hypothetical protein